jgi:hypothetical protein
MAHRLAGQTVLLSKSSQWDEGTEYQVEDSAIDVLGTEMGNPARLFGTMRMMDEGKKVDPQDPELLYGKIGSLGFMVHSSEILEGESSPSPTSMA